MSAWDRRAAALAEWGRETNPLPGETLADYAARSRSRGAIVAFIVAENDIIAMNLPLTKVGRPAHQELDAPPSPPRNSLKNWSE